MIRIGLREARAHLGRFAMSIIAIMLGVSFVVGSFCFREMLNNQVDEMMASNADHDVYVRGSEEVKDDDAEASAASTETEYNDINDDLTDTIASVTGVQTAEIVYSISNGMVLVAHNGDAVSSMGAPTIAIGFSETQPWRSASMIKGAYAVGDHEVALDEQAAQRSGLNVGDATKLVYPEGPRSVKVTGIFRTSSSQAGAILLQIDPAVAKKTQERTTGKSGTTRYISVYGSANGGKALDAGQQQALADAINDRLPADAKAHAITGDQMRDENAKATKDALGFIQPLILIFAVIALFVGSFIIANTFSMIVRESMRGYALLRSVGASPGQVFSTVIVQAVVLGLIGSLAGIGLGWGVVKLIVMGMERMGTPISGSSNPTVTDMLVGLVVGMIVTFVGASLPARRAALAPPIQAMNETVNPEKPVTMRGILGAVMCLIGAGAWTFTVALVGADGNGPTPWPWLNDVAVGWPLGVGAALLVVGVIVTGPSLVSVAGVILGWLPSKIFRVTGTLAKRNLSRSKRRTANTAAALFVGVAIVSCLGVVASSAKASVAGIVDTGLKADYAIMSASSGQLPQGAVDDVKKVDGVKSTASNRFIMGVKYDGEQVGGMTIAVQPALFTDVFAPVTKAGDPTEALKNDELVVGEDVAKDQGWNVGDTVTVSAKKTLIDQEATARARKEYQAKVESEVRSLMAQGRAQEAQARMDEAGKVDPSTLIRTRTETTSRTVKVGAIITNNVYRSCVMVNDDLGERFGTKQTMFTIQMYVVADPGADKTDVQRRIKDAVKPYYTVSVMNHEEYKSTMSSMVDQILLILYALLALSIVIAIFGIVNTLALSVSERTKEIGLLRAIGTSRGQIRGMLAIEASIISVFGTVLGLIVGVAAGAVIRKVYESDGLEMLSVPWSQLVVFLLVSVLVGLLASVSPASRALRKPVLDAVASE
ncbi:Permease of ABC transporter system [Bifidobacterium margollesii]|uniref:Permease of ABC transporter system n=1 Tax=Bifidobacterium margollesii TaxID=2020964 RepID=A0A2N5J8D8_9BIFI|nr:FtsX-like permease family protein [Bifidobacterium margollesii]PLS30455.1 Permease of ABC transporter system [Bifidobacterium margollesii]